MRILERRNISGFVNHALYRILLDACAQVPGVYMEMGIFKGATFNHIYKKAKRYHKKPLAIDSFIGMPEGLNECEIRKFPQGAFDTGGSEWFRKKYPGTEVYEGFIPDVLSKIPMLKIAFVHIDLDHEKPTYESLDWCWARLSKMGIIVCHDFNWIEQDCAAKGIRDWMHDHEMLHVIEADHSIVFRKGESES